MIAIKGLEMPKSCNECGFGSTGSCVFNSGRGLERYIRCSVISYGNGKVHLQKGSEKEYLTKRLDVCPLVEVVD